jgi:short-subunit dehydrogenase
MRGPRAILITGASSGIGESLALRYAGKGVALALTGRDRTRLDRVAEACRGKGSTVLAEAIDTTDAAAMERFVAAAEKFAPLELVIANAGISGGTGFAGEGPEQARRIFAVNLDGVLNTVLPALPYLRKRRRGQVALMSSLASFRGFPGAPAYCASKAAVRVWGEGLRPLLAAEGIGVSVICPGFVTSRMTEGNAFPMPFLMDSARAARIIADGLAANRARIAFPLPMRLSAWMLAALPPGLTDPAMRRLPNKRAMGER